MGYLLSSDVVGVYKHKIEAQDYIAKKKSNGSRKEFWIIGKDVKGWTA